MRLATLLRWCRNRLEAQLKAAAIDLPAFLDDFQQHWPTDRAYTYVDFVRDGLAGNGAAVSSPSFAVASWLRDADRDGRLTDALQPGVTPEERRAAQVEGWILGI